MHAESGIAAPPGQPYRLGIRRQAKRSPAPRQPGLGSGHPGGIGPQNRLGPGDVGPGDVGPGDVGLCHAGSLIR